MQNVALLHSLIREMDAMDLFGHVYEDLCTTSAASYTVALKQNQERGFVRSRITAARRRLGSTQVFPQVLRDPSGEGLTQHNVESYRVGDPTALLLLPKIKRVAYRRASETMLQYLDWLSRNYEGESDASIATSLGRSEATIRGGRKRAIEFLIEVAHDLRHGGTTDDGELPDPLQKAANLLVEQELERAWMVLSSCKFSCEEDPRWFNIAGLVCVARGDYEDALAHLRSGLVLADEAKMRAKLLNNQGKALHNMGRLKRAQASYLRAWRLAPEGAPPLLNLLAVASERQDLQDCRYYAHKLVQLLRDGGLPMSTQKMVCERLSENPLYDWVKRTVAWKGPSRWLRRWAQIAAAVLVAMFLGLGGWAAPVEAQGFAPSAGAPRGAATLQGPAPSSPSVYQGDKGEGWILPAGPPAQSSRKNQSQPKSQGDKGEGWILPKAGKPGSWWERLMLSLQSMMSTPWD